MPSETSYEARIIELEIRTNEQERQIEELSGIVTEQWKTIDVLSKKLASLITRFLELEEQSAPEISVTKPPHW